MKGIRVLLATAVLAGGGGGAFLLGARLPASIFWGMAAVFVVMFVVDAADRTQAEDAPRSLVLMTDGRWALWFIWAACVIPPLPAACPILRSA